MWAYMARATETMEIRQPKKMSEVLVKRINRVTASHKDFKRDKPEDHFQVFQEARHKGLLGKRVDEVDEAVLAQKAKPIKLSKTGVSKDCPAKNTDPKVCRDTCYGSIRIDPDGHTL
jgi:hypothetical protein